MSALDLIQAFSYEKGIAAAFAWAGWEYERVSGEAMREHAVTAIEAGIPFIAFGLTDPPEAALVCGYGDEGQTLCGWSHFQNGMETLENGMFQASDWEGRAFELLIPVRKTECTLPLQTIIASGTEIMEKTKADGYLVGDAAHAAWYDAIASCGQDTDRLFRFHRKILFNLAEARCWCGKFLTARGVKAGKHFATIHNLCWEANAAVPNAAALADAEKRAALLSIMEKIRAQDEAAHTELTPYLKTEK